MDLLELRTLNEIARSPQAQVTVYPGGRLKMVLAHLKDRGWIELVSPSIDEFPVEADTYRLTFEGLKTLKSFKRSRRGREKLRRGYETR